MDAVAILEHVQRVVRERRGGDSKATIGTGGPVITYGPGPVITYGPGPVNEAPATLPPVIVFNPKTNGYDVVPTWLLAVVIVVAVLGALLSTQLTVMLKAAEPRVPRLMIAVIATVWWSIGMRTFLLLALPSTASSIMQENFRVVSLVSSINLVVNIVLAFTVGGAFTSWRSSLLAVAAAVVMLITNYFATRSFLTPNATISGAPPSPSIPQSNATNNDAVIVDGRVVAVVAVNGNGK